MRKHQLGQSALEVSPIIFGGNVFGWTADEATSFRLLDAYLDAGGNMIDTADVYSRWVPGLKGGESEAIIGKWLAQSGKRDAVLIATKSGKSEAHPGLSRASIIAAVDESLQRLGTDVIDLMQAHAFDPDTPQEETLAAYDELLQAGKIRVIGASNFSAGELRAALAISTRDKLPRYESVQPLYNLMERKGYEAELAALATAEDVGVITYASLASGFLTGKYRQPGDFTHRARKLTGVDAYLNAHGRRVLTALDEVAARHDVTPTPVALGWLLTRPGVTATIVSATSTAQLDEIMAAPELTLDPEDLDKLDAVSR